ncbi:hypothetical protein B0A50_08714 [Salinomyces thailandicus]|uniref:IBR domain-containing protein n=1 Tax=Salinomyces thailandicus TaxID=706561 RepID=A0A4V5N349_9PEZI|nr:hypothetical protein B0A50_08714 [Salinomyces thailandica]
MSISTMECTVCLEASTEHITILENAVCIDCVTTSILPQFHAALRFEHAYPPTWGTTPLNPIAFLHYLPAGFLTRWLEREEEYRTPPHQRIYCQHLHPAPLPPSATVTPSLASSSPSPTSETPPSPPQEICNHFFGSPANLLGSLTPHTCPTCTSLTCETCELPIPNPTAHQPSCPAPDPTSTDNASPFATLTRGADYQLCAGCALPAELKDGCNCVACPKCRTETCFLCGSAAEHYGGHFAVGQPCVLFGRPGPQGIHAPPAEEIARLEAEEEEAAALEAAEAEAEWEAEIIEEIMELRREIWRHVAIQNDARDWWARNEERLLWLEGREEGLRVMEVEERGRRWAEEDRREREEAVREKEWRVRVAARTAEGGFDGREGLREEFRRRVRVGEERLRGERDGEGAL